MSDDLSAHKRAESSAHVPLTLLKMLITHSQRPYDVFDVFMLFLFFFDHGSHIFLFRYAGQVGGVPSDVAEQIASMQKAIDALSAEISSVSLPF